MPVQFMDRVVGEREYPTVKTSRPSLEHRARTLDDDSPAIGVLTRHMHDEGPVVFAPTAKPEIKVIVRVDTRPLAETILKLAQFTSLLK